MAYCEDNPRRLGARSRRAGVTLIELMIAITLVAAISTGMLFAMRTSLGALEKTHTRFAADRIAAGKQELLYRQLAGIMPAMGSCGLPILRGTPLGMVFVTSYSMEEGARGAPRVVEYQTSPDPAGGYQLAMSEFPYLGPAADLPFCGPQVPIGLPTPNRTVLAQRLKYCRFIYRDYRPDAPVLGEWLPIWNRRPMPSAVRIEMEAQDSTPNAMPVLAVTVPIRVTREVGAPYADQQ